MPHSPLFLCSADTIRLRLELKLKLELELKMPYNLEVFCFIELSPICYPSLTRF